MQTKPILCVASVLSALACHHAAEPESPACQPPQPCSTAGDDEVGEQPPPLECTASTVDGKQGLKYQCEGSLSMGFEFSLLGKGCDSWLVWPPCDQFYSFGFEDYVETQVMACCDAWDGSEEHGAVVREYCTGDMVEQICLSASEQLVTGASMLEDGAVKEGVLKLQNHVAENIGTCIAALWANDSPDDDLLITRWDLGDLFGLKDISLVVDDGEITGFVLADEPETCESNQDNNLETFEPPLPAPFMPKDLLALDGSTSLHVSGPQLLGSKVEGSGVLASGALQFATDDSGTSWLVEASWRPAGTLELGNELGSVSIEDGRIELRGGARLSGSTEVAAGDAHFMLLGRVDGQIRRIAGSNATPIEVREDAGVVYTSAFELVVLDDQGQRWVVSLTASQWR